MGKNGEDVHTNPGYAVVSQEAYDDQICTTVPPDITKDEGAKVPLQNWHRYRNIIEWEMEDLEGIENIIFHQPSKPHVLGICVSLKKKCRPLNARIDHTFYAVLP